MDADEHLVSAPEANAYGTASKQETRYISFLSQYSEFGPYNS